MTYSIKHLFHISSQGSEVFKAISTIDGLASWWTAQTTGSADKEGIIRFRFGPGGGPDMKVTDIVPDESISWECVESNHGWKGNKIRIILDENEGKTRVRFSHEGWADDGDFYAICTFTWGRFMESLRQYCQTGKGEPFVQPASQ